MPSPRARWNHALLWGECFFTWKMACTHPIAKAYNHLSLPDNMNVSWEVKMELQGLYPTTGAEKPGQKQTLLQRPAQERTPMPADSGVLHIDSFCPESSRNSSTLRWPMKWMLRWNCACHCCPVSRAVRSKWRTMPRLQAETASGRMCESLSKWHRRLPDCHQIAAPASLLGSPESASVCTCSKLYKIWKC